MGECGGGHGGVGRYGLLGERNKTQVNIGRRNGTGIAIFLHELYRFSDLQFKAVFTVIMRSGGVRVEGRQTEIRTGIFRRHAQGVGDPVELFFFGKLIDKR